MSGIPSQWPLLLPLTSVLALLATNPSPPPSHPSISPIRGRRHPYTIRFSDDVDTANASSIPTFIRHQLKSLRKYTASRLAISLVLSSLSLVCVLRERSDEAGTGFVVYLYLVLLAARAHHPPRILASLRRRDTYSLHLDVLLLFLWTRALSGVFTSTSSEDTETSILHFLQFSLLSISAILIPLIRPRIYLGTHAGERTSEEELVHYLDLDFHNDLDHEKALPAEQTASLLSFLFYGYLDTYVWGSYRNSKKSEMKAKEEKGLDLPTLGYDDGAEVLTSRSEHIFEMPTSTSSNINANLIGAQNPPTKGPGTSLFRHLVKLHLSDCIWMCILLVLNVVVSFGAPYALQRILFVLEHRTSHTLYPSNENPYPHSHSHEQTSKNVENAPSPAPYIALLFLSPILAAILLQMYAWLSTRVALRVEAALMGGFIRRGMRMRVGSTTGATTATNDSAPTSDSASRNEPEALPKTQHTKPQPPSLPSLLTTDLSSLSTARDLPLLLITVPLNLLLATLFLHASLGSAAFVGMGVMLGLVGVPGWFARRIGKIEGGRVERTDGRVEGVEEAVGMLRMIKLFGWESYIGRRIEKQREDELEFVRKRRVLEMMKGVSNFLIPVVTMLATYATYVTLVIKQQLTASKVFSSMAVFDILRGQFHLTFHTLGQVVAGAVSLGRVEAYLKDTELLDEFVNPEDSDMEDGDEDETIGFSNASFTWTSDASGYHSQIIPSLTTRQRPFTLRIEGDLIFPPNSFTLVVGPTGSGKTSLLLALLGEMHMVEDRNTHSLGWYNLPRAEGVAYAAQETWVLSDTIKNNILFGSIYNEERYNAVIQQCALERDLEIFAAGDETEVGEKGTTLSGGQKARVTLARAIYSDAEILLLDDVFAALDVHTSQWIIEKCFGGELLKNRTVILVTHNVSVAKKLATHVVRLSHDGSVSYQGTINKVLLDVLSKHVELVDSVDSESDLESPQELQAEISVSTFNGVDVGDTSVALAAPTEKLIVAEATQEGRDHFDAVKLYLLALGGKHYVLFFVMFGGGIIASELLGMLQTWFLGYWAAQYDEPGKVNVTWYLSVYGAILTCSMVVYMTAYVTYINGGLRASRIIHQKLISSILGTTFRWLDTTPTSRIITRCTQDIGAVDGIITGMIQWLTELTVSMLVKLGAIVFITPFFIGPGLAVTLFSGWLCQIYTKSQVVVKREMSNARAPILGHFATTMAGLVSIRAYGTQDAFVKEAMQRIDCYTRSARTFYNLTRWITIRLDIIGAFFTSSLAVYLVYFQSQSASNTGFSLNMAIAFSGTILYWVMFANDLEVQATSLERIHEYLCIAQEPKSDAKWTPPAYWPASGDLRVRNLSAKYSENSPEVLHEISFHAKSGEYVGIVGRTGSGKTSLTLALLRAILTFGEVHYDNLRTDQINLDSLRKNITIIPQAPELLAGTLRQNLDPFGEYDDARLNDALRSTGLFSLHPDDKSESNFTLDTPISAGGLNISIGQRQIIALARAIVRNSKLLILDEATSAIDHETDLLIQSTLRHQLGKDVTLLVVAHRINTVIDADKIMVLDDGHIVEYDSPEVLLKNPDGIFKALVDNSGDQSTKD